MSTEAAAERPDERNIPAIEGSTVEAAFRAGLISAAAFEHLADAGLAALPIREITLGDIAAIGSDTAAVAASLLHAAQDDVSEASLRIIGANDLEGPAGDERPHDSVPIGDLLRLGLISVRTHNRLVTGHVAVTDEPLDLRTVGGIRKLTEDQLLSLRGLGRVAIDELRAAGVLDRTAQREWMPAAPHADAEVHGESDRQLGGAGDLGDAQPRTLDELGAAIRRAVPPVGVAILRLRDAQTLDSLARARGVSRERIRQQESRALRGVSVVLMSVLPTAIPHWAALMERAPVSESELFGPFMDAASDTDEQLQIGRIALRAAIPGVRRARILGERMEDYWTVRNAAVGADAINSGYAERLREFAEFGPYRDDDLDEALGHFEIDVTLARAVLDGPSSPLVHLPALAVWVRRMAQTRDACFLILERAGRPVSSEVLGRILDITPRNIAAHLERDDRFRRIYGQKRWALNAWGDLGDGTRYRTTKEAMVDILTRESPLDREELTRRVQAVHPVTSWSVNNWLEDEIFGRFPDGRFGLAFQGAVPYEESEPNLAAEVDPPIDPTAITFHMRVTKDLLRGSGLGIPRYVTWFVGLRRVPSERAFRRHDDSEIVLKRRAGFATISSLRSDAQRLRLSEDCLLRVSLDLAHSTAALSASCPCHS